MCGRYDLSAEDSAEIKKIIQQINDKYRGQEIKTGEIFPTNPAPVLMELASEITPVPMAWGFPNFGSKGVLINARAETALEKPIFRNSVLLRRCVIPSTGFYEWDKSKQKYKFSLPGQDTLYMAGLWKEYDGVKRFVILTTAPNASISHIHNRMPLVLPKDSVRSWVLDSSVKDNVLRTVPPLLNKVIVHNGDSLKG